MTEQERLHEEDLQRIRGFRLMDDDFMNVCLENNPEDTELILRIILGDGSLKVIDSKTQYLIKSLKGRDVWLDVKAEDANGRQMNIEIQRDDRGAARKRARYHSSIMDSNIMKPGQDFDDLPETYVIFITENDVLGGDLPIYHIERHIVEMDNDPFGDEEHIIYVNGANEDSETELGKLMHDFKCTNPDDMFFKELAKRPRYFKETDEGVKAMCKVIEDMRNQTVWNTKVEVVKGMIEIGLSHEQIAKAAKLTVEQVKEIAGEKSA
ncbi:MAG: PD-(D/E)XK nuclease family transposase [Butyrivibrio sp.]|nr:PD-(D/E)XK nuclease family transposase [Butyrivibrio sp.]